MLYEGNTFTKRPVKLDGCEFRRCNFEKCVLVYAGGTIPRLVDCHFSKDTSFRFDGPALNGVLFLKMLATPGSPTHQAVIDAFPELFTLVARIG
jgi:hypothetical protein